MNKYKTDNKTRNTWHALRTRCKGKSGKLSLKNYKSKGITYDPRWEKFENFIQDMGERPLGKELDRIDNTKGYFKENCRWVTRGHNEANKIFPKKSKEPRGVTAVNGRYRARMKVNQKFIHLGYYPTPEQAERAYLNAYFDTYGEMPPDYRRKIKSEVKEQVKLCKNCGSLACFHYGEYQAESDGECKRWQPIPSVVKEWEEI